MKINDFFGSSRMNGFPAQLARIMKLTILIMTVVLLQVSAASKAQITIRENKMKMQKVLESIGKQSGYDFIYSVADLKNIKPVDLKLNDVNLETALKASFEGQPLIYEISDKTVIVRRQEEKSIVDRIIGNLQAIDVRGKVVDENGNPLAGATVKVVDGKSVITNQEGEFYLLRVDEKAIIVISYIGYKPVELKVKEDMGLIRLEMATSDLQEVVVNKGYYTEKKALSTGSTGSIKAADIEKQPVSNVLQALYARVPGIVISQSSGYNGGGLKVQIRGQNSLLNGSEPLFIIDGVPFAPNNSNISQINSVISNGNISPFSLIESDNIESIEILKDADATSIYGSRGSNGVILITTKKGKAGKTSFDLNVYSGFSKVSKMTPMLNTDEYLNLRKEAFKNDGTTPTNSNAADLKIYNQTAYTDWQKWLVGGTAHTTNVSSSLGGGNENTQFLFGGNYHFENTVFPTSDNDKKVNFNISLNHKSTDKRFFANFSGNYGYDENGIFNVSGTSIGEILTLPPNAPSLTDSDGNLVWRINGVNFKNPKANFLRKYGIESNNLIANFGLGYELSKGLVIKSNFGYNSLKTKENSIIPIAAQNPNSSGLTGTASFGNNNFNSLIIEPQIEYNTLLKGNKVNILLGGSWQSIKNDGLYITGGGYTSDNQLGSLSSAPQLDYYSSSYSKYLYAAVFGRINYNIDDKYIINLSGRRDGSSRFGSGKKFSNFGAAGAAWIFSGEDFFKANIPFISFGKLRASYGITGNDQIGDYKYLDTWSSNVAFPYNGTTSLTPDALYNPDYSWEINKKIEGALEFGLFTNRILASVGYFRNKSSNQLLQYILPSQTGFTSILQNFPATIVNNGWEIELNSQNIKKGDFTWSTSLNITIPKNRLSAFPNLASTTYASKFVIGESTRVLRGYKSIGVNSQTGLMSYEDIDHSGLTNTNDYQTLGDLDPKYYGGLSNSIGFKSVTIDFLFEFKKQMGANFLSSFFNTSYYPGRQFNQSSLILDHWRNIGDITNIQRVSTGTGIIQNLAYSDALYSDASYIRLKNLSLSFNVPKNVLKKAGVSSARIFVAGQNLFLITKFKGADPEIQNTLTLQPLKTWVIGAKLTF